MRIDRFVPTRPSQDPTRSGSMHEAYVSEGQPAYDIFLIEGSIFVCREGCIAVYGPQGTAYIGADAGRGVVEAFNKRFPRGGAKEKK